MYEMEEEYKSGIESIDNYYERLFKMIDKAYEILEGTSVEKYCGVIQEVERFKKEIEGYFRKQEEYLISMDHDEFEIKKKENEDFLKKIDQIDIEDIIRKGNQYVVNTLQYFSDWLVEHVLIVEKK